jgi:2,3-bisphosphoglycerate-independent phosphoglycerate mutase
VNRIKYAFLVPDGAADHALDELEGKTPLQAASTPQIDYLAEHGRLGKVKTIPAKMSPGSDVATLSLLGYDPVKYYDGRGPLEAASMGIELKKGQVAFRCNLVTVQNGILEDFSAGHITTREAKSLIASVQDKLGSNAFTFYPGVSYRHLMVAEGDFSSTVCLPPHDVVGKPIEEIMPTGDGSDVIRRLMLESVGVLAKNQVNRTRQKEQKNPASMIWLWGQGRAPSLPSLKSRYGIEGAVISAVDLIKGIGCYAGLQSIAVPGATGYFDTDYSAKARAALKALEQKDFVFVHVEAPDEAGHIGNIEEKIKAIENFDQRIVRPIFEGLGRAEQFKILIAPDHATPIKVRTHTAEPVPFLIYSSAGSYVSGKEGFYEAAAEDSVLNFEYGFELMDYFIRKNGDGGSR